MDARGTVTAEEGDRYPLKPPLKDYMSKVYIAVLDTVPNHMVPVLVAHSMLGAHLLFDRENLEYKDWLTNSFRKVVLKVNSKEFAKIYFLDSIYCGYENTVLDGKTSCLVLAPRNEYPNVIKFAKMWKP